MATRKLRSNLEDLPRIFFSCMIELFARRRWWTELRADWCISSSSTATPDWLTPASVLISVIIYVKLGRSVRGKGSRVLGESN